MRFVVEREKGVDLLQVERMGRSIVNLQPLHATALDGRGDVMNGVGAIGETDVENRGHLCFRRRTAPKQVRPMKVVVRPERLKHTEERTQPGMQGQERVLYLTLPLALREVSLKRRLALHVTREFGPRIVIGKNLEAGHQGRRAARRHAVSCGSNMQCSEGPPRVSRVFHT